MCARVVAGQVHPALLCAALHGERLGNWQVAVSVATRLLELELFNMSLRAASLRLLSRALIHLGQPERARTSAEGAVECAKSAQYRWLEMLALRDLLLLDEGEGGRDDEENGAWARLLQITGGLKVSVEDLSQVLGEDLTARLEATKFGC